MEKLRKQIKDSFFNPIIYFLPLITYLVVDDFYGMSVARKVSFLVAFVLLIYVYLFYNRIFFLHLNFIILFVIVSLVVGLETFFSVNKVGHEIGFEIALVITLFVLILLKNKVKLRFQGLISNLIPISNNLEELYRVIWAFFFVLLFYIASFFAVQFFDGHSVAHEKMLQNVCVCIVIFLTVYESLRVQLVRSKLIKEEWWPIVSNQGKIVGCIHYLTSLNDEKKYMHPVVRVLLVEKSMVLLQKRSSNDFVYPDLWDTAISNHVKMGETVEQCVERTAEKRYSFKNFKYMYLANYTLNLEKEKHFAFLYVSCLQSEFKFNSSSATQLKWWTQQQIEENLEAGIFTENFRNEFDLLKRSGLLETGQCECSCKLRDVIYNQPSANKKEYPE